MTPTEQIRSVFPNAEIKVVGLTDGSFKITVSGIEFLISIDEASFFIEEYGKKHFCDLCGKDLTGIGFATTGSFGKYGVMCYGDCDEI